MKRLLDYHERVPCAAVVLGLCGMVLVGAAWAAPVSSDRAEQVVWGWLHIKGRTALGLEARHKRIGPASTYYGPRGECLYHVVPLEPQGFVIVAGDDQAEPVIAFSMAGRFEPSAGVPLADVLERDLSRRFATAADRLRQRSVPSRIPRRWEQLQEADDIPQPPSDPITNMTDLDDVRVPPLVASTWGQTTVGNYINGLSLYNYYTGPYEDGNSNNYPCGCVATSMVQLMRYHEHPTASPWYFNYGLMPLVPKSTITLAQRQEIGRFCFAAAEAVDTQYGASGSSASLYDAAHELVDTFGFGQGIYGYNQGNNIGAAVLLQMINPNLDARLPVLLGLDGASGGHAVVCDGYGYDAGTLYHHLNMGWSGLSDVWYALPDVDATYHEFNTVDVCVYNLFTSGTGQVVSGRVTDPFGAPLSGVSMGLSARGSTFSTLTDLRGVYGQRQLPSNTNVTITPSKRDWTFTARTVKTGWSIQRTQTCGNLWAVDFVGYPAVGLIRFDREVYVAGQTVTIQLADAALIGRQQYDVLVTTTAGDQESVQLTETATNSGAFEGSIPTAEAGWIAGDGVLQVWDGQTLTVTYPDGTTTDSATIEGTATLEPPTAYGQLAYVPTGQATTILLEVEDDGFPQQILHCVVTSLPAYGILQDAQGRTITTDDLPYTLPQQGRTVDYTPGDCFVGLDEFAFVADDGGDAPQGGWSDPAGITVAAAAVMGTHFEQGLPAGWQVIDGYADGMTWQWSDAEGYAMMLVDSDAAGKVWMDEQLISPPVDCSAFQVVKLVYDHDFYFNEDEIGDVDVRVDGGPWQRVRRYQGADDWAVVELDVSNVAAGRANVQIRWRYHNAFWDWYWALFSVGVLGSPSAVPGDVNADCRVNLSDFARLAASWNTIEQNPAWDGACDLAEPRGLINVEDLQVLVDYWLSGP